MRTSKKITFCVLLLSVITGFMWIGATLQLYLNKLPEMDVPGGTPVWVKAVSFLYFPACVEYKGTFSESMELIFEITFVISILTIFVDLLLFIREMKKSRGISEGKSSPAAS